MSLTLAPPAYAEFDQREAEKQRTHVGQFVGPAVDGNVIGYLVIHEPFEVRQSWETACNYTAHQVQPGVYPVRVTGSPDNRDVVCGVDTIITQEYSVNRIFSATSVRDERPMKPGRYTFRTYEYAAAEASCVDRPKLFGGDFVMSNGYAVVTTHHKICGWSDESPARHYTCRRFAQLDGA